MFPVVVSRRALLLGSVTPLTPKVAVPAKSVPYLKHAVILGSLATEIIETDRRDLQERAYLAKVLDAYDVAVSHVEDPPFARDVLRSTLQEPFPGESRYDT